MEKKSLNKISHLIFHLTAYNVVWGTCIYSASKGMVWLGLLVALFVTALQFLWQTFIPKKTQKLFIFLIYSATIGFIGDSLLIFLGFISFSATPFQLPISPPFMLGLWLNFGMLFYSILLKLITRPQLLYILSFFGFGGAYYLGARIGAAFLVKGLYSVFAIGFIWMILFPTSIVLFDYLVKFPREAP